MLINPYYIRPVVYPEDGLQEESSKYLRNEYGAFLEYDPVIVEDGIQTEDDIFITAEDQSPIQFDSV